MPSALLDTMGQLHVVSGKIAYASGVPALTCNDGSATLANTNTGIATLTFGEPFLSVPSVVCQALKATESATTNNLVVLDSVTTSAVVFRFKSDAAGTNSTADPADTDGCLFIAVGMRNV